MLYKCIEAKIQYTSCITIIFLFDQFYLAFFGRGLVHS